LVLLFGALETREDEDGRTNERVTLPLVVVVSEGFCEAEGGDNKGCCSICSFVKGRF
jgi:hypothetical protein